MDERGRQAANSEEKRRGSGPEFEYTGKYSLAIRTRGWLKSEKGDMQFRCQENDMKPIEAYCPGYLVTRCDEGDILEVECSTQIDLEGKHLSFGLVIKG